MLSSLTIKNFGLIDNLSIEFCKGLNILTGATGAGKSILIDALHYSLGEKMNSSYVRDKNSPCMVEAVFDLPDRVIKNSPVLSEYLETSDPVFIINRTYTYEGRNRNKINGLTVTTSQLKELGNLLVDFHGPHDHQMLFSESSHLDILDRLSSLEKIKKDYTEHYRSYLKTRKKIDEVKKLSEQSDHELDILAHQIKELEQVPLEETEYEELITEHNRISNAEKLHIAVNETINIVENEQTGISNAIINAFAPLKDLNNIDKSTEWIAGILENIQENTSELLCGLNKYADSLSFDPASANEVNEHYDIYSDILRKYGPTLESARIFYENIRKKYDLITDMEHNTRELAEELKSKESKIRQIAGRISSIRGKTAIGLKANIEKELKELGIKHVCFECRIEPSEIGRDGCDNVVFFISPNAGEALKPLAEIVSSGEAARVMLALKRSLTKVDPIDVLIFDEIDAQIGGRLGTITGKKLKELSGDRQVILITHLPQIASFGDRHFKVSKKVSGKRTVTEIKTLEGDIRVKELAKMMSGEKESGISIDHARHMLEIASEV